ncbi:hypothetical protein ACVBEH_10055 [Roseateles sp. GG27B]
MRCHSTPLQLGLVVLGADLVAVRGTQLGQASIYRPAWPFIRCVDQGLDGI